MASGPAALSPCAACLPTSPASRSRRPGRRLLLLQSLRAGAVAAVGTSAVPADVCHGRDSKFSHFEALHVTERSNILELPSHKHTANAADHKLHRQQQPGAVAPAPFCGDSGAPAPVAAPPTRPAPRVLEVCSASELRHLMTCHPNRLLVVHFAAGGCPLGEVRGAGAVLLNNPYVQNRHRLLHCKQAPAPRGPRSPFTLLPPPPFCGSLSRPLPPP